MHPYYISHGNTTYRVMPFPGWSTKENTREYKEFDGWRFTLILVKKDERLQTSVIVCRVVLVYLDMIPNSSKWVSA